MLFGRCTLRCHTSLRNKLHLRHTGKIFLLHAVKSCGSGGIVLHIPKLGINFISVVIFLHFTDSLRGKELPFFNELQTECVQSQSRRYGEDSICSGLAGPDLGLNTVPNTLFMHSYFCVALSNTGSSMDSVVFLTPQSHPDSRFRGRVPFLRENVL